MNKEHGQKAVNALDRKGKEISTKAMPHIYKILIWGSIGFAISIALSKGIDYYKNRKNFDNKLK